MERQHLGYRILVDRVFRPGYLLPLTALGKSRIRGVRDDGPYSCFDFSDKSRERNESETGLDKSCGENKSGKENEDLSGNLQDHRIFVPGERTNRLAANEAWYLSTVAYEESQYSDSGGLGGLGLWWNTGRS